MSEEEIVVAALAKKDADFVEKFVGRVLKLSSENWGKRANEAFAKSPGAESDEEYNEAFDQWHRLRLNIVYVEDEIICGRDRTEEMPWEQTVATDTFKSPTSEGG